MPIIQQILFIVIIQIIYFYFFYKFGIKLSKIIHKRVCPTCFSVSSTWLTLIGINLIVGNVFNHYIIAILLAESVVGISYLTEEFLSRNTYKITEPILRFGTVVYGTIAVMIFALISQPLGFLLFLPVILYGFWALTPVK